MDPRGATTDTVCEATRFGLSDPQQASDFLSRLEAIEPSSRRSGALDLPSLCAVRTDPALQSAYNRNAEATAAIIAEMLGAGAFGSCRTDPLAVLRILDRLERD